METGFYDLATLLRLVAEHSPRLSDCAGPVVGTLAVAALAFVGYLTTRLAEFAVCLASAGVFAVPLLLKVSGWAGVF